MELENKRICVTGGKGFLGRHVVEALRARGCWRVVTPTHNAYDLRRREEVLKMFRHCNPEIVINLAASLGGIGANAANPGKFFYDNIMIGAEVMEVAREYGVEKLVNMGTSCSYPAKAKSPVKEEYLGQGLPNEVTGPYGVAKLALITMAKGYRKQYGLNAITLIPANIYGPYDSFDPKRSHVIPALIMKAMEAKEKDTGLEVWGSGRATREFIYAKDCAEAIVLATESYNEPEPINLGTGIETSILSVARNIAGIVGFRGSITLDTDKPDGQLTRVFSVKRAQEKLGFKATTSLWDGLKSTVEWYIEDLNRRSQCAKPTEHLG